MSVGLNAAARTFEKAKNTIFAWERKAEPAKFEAESATSGIHKSVALDAP
jgi:hypothetical protein